MTHNFEIETRRLTKNMRIIMNRDFGGEVPQMWRRRILNTYFESVDLIEDLEEEGKIEEATNIAHSLSDFTADAISLGIDETEFEENEEEDLSTTKNQRNIIGLR